MSRCERCPQFWRLNYLTEDIWDISQISSLQQETDFRDSTLSIIAHNGYDRDTALPRDGSYAQGSLLERARLLAQLMPGA